MGIDERAGQLHMASWIDLSIGNAFERASKPVAASTFHSPVLRNVAREARDGEAEARPECTLSKPLYVLREGTLSDFRPAIPPFPR